MARSDGYIEVTVRFSKEGKQWTALCVELGTAAFGETLESACEAINDMIELHLNSLDQLGTREAFLKKHGVKFHRGVPDADPKPRSVTVRPGDFVTTRTERIPVVMAM